MTTAWLTASPTPLGPPGGVHALVGGDDAPRSVRRPGPWPCLADEVGQLRERGEAREVRAGCAALQDDVEEVAAGHPDDADQAVEQRRPRASWRARGARPGAGSGRCPAPPSRRAPRGSCGRRGRRTIAEPPAPAISSAVTIGPASRTTASTAADAGERLRAELA